MDADGLTSMMHLTCGKNLSDGLHSVQQSGEYSKKKKKLYRMKTFHHQHETPTFFFLPQEMQAQNTSSGEYQQAELRTTMTLLNGGLRLSTW